MSHCTSCKHALPGGCSACRPLGYWDSLLKAEATAHTCPQCMRGLPCDPSPNVYAEAARRLSDLPCPVPTHVWMDDRAVQTVTAGCDPSSLSSLVGQIATRKPSEADWKGREFGGWDANGSPASSYPGSETM